MERTSISSGTATDSTVLTSTEEHLQAFAPATTTGGSLEGHSVAAVEPKPLYRLAPEGWQEMSGTEGWQSTHRFDNTTPTAAHTSTPPAIHRAAVTFFGNNYNRSETIDKRKAAFQAGLCQEKTKTTSPASGHRIFGLQHLIAVLEKASSYQKAMVSHLQESGSARSISLQKSYFSKINESPNKIEKIAHQLEVNIKDLLTHQALLDIAEAHIAPHITLGEPPPQDLLNTKQRLIACISHQEAFIEAKAAYAKLLPPPYEVIDEATQTAIDQLASTCRQESLLARKIPLTHNRELNAAFSSHYEAEARQQAAEEAQQPQPRGQVIALFTQSADRYRQAAALYATGDADRGRALAGAGRCFFLAAEEAQGLQPREQVIAWFTQSVDLLQQAAAAYATGDRDWGISLNWAGTSFFLAAEEAQELQPRGQVIAWFTQSVDLLQQAAYVFTTGDTDRGISLNWAGRCFFLAAKEAQELQPRGQVIALFTQSADRYQQAAAACAPRSRLALGKAGRCFFLAAEEAPQPQAQEQVIALFTQAADLFQQAAAAFATGVMTKSPLLLVDAGNSFLRAAEEAQQPQAQEEVIALFTQSADRYQQAAAACAPRSRLALAVAGTSFLRAAVEAQQPQPDQATIDRYVRNAQENIRKANSSGSCAIS